MTLDDAKRKWEEYLGLPLSWQAMYEWRADLTADNTPGGDDD